MKAVVWHSTGDIRLDTVNDPGIHPNGPDVGTCFFGAPQSTGPVNGLQAEYARIPYAAATLVRVPD